jgi:hypothetical protein
MVTKTFSLQHVYFQGSIQPELPSSDSALGGHNIKTKENKADRSVNQELDQNKTSSDQPNVYHKVSFENHICVKYLIILTRVPTF